MMQKTLRYFFALIIFSVSAYVSQAQDCGCDHVVNPPADRATSVILDGNVMGVKPGQTVCLSAGFYMQIRFLRMTGEPGNPVTIKNCGGLVEIGDAITFGRWYAVDIGLSSYMRLTGTGVQGLKYGIKLGKSGDSALKIGVSTDTEIDHLDIGNANFAGILAKTDYRGVVPPDAPEMNNVNIHDNYIHDTRGEGMYIGETTTPGQDFRHLEIWNNIVTRTGFDLLQVANAIEDVQVHHNVLYKGGVRNVLFQNKGLQIGDNSVGQYYNNFIIGSPSNSMIVLGSGNIDIYNNYMQGAGDPALFIDNRSVTLPGTPINVRNNYLMEVRSTVPFINVFNEKNPVNITANFVDGSNVVVGYGPGVGANVTVSNTTVGPITRAEFTDLATDNFTLPDGSPYAELGLMEDVSNRNNRPFIAIIPEQKLDAEMERAIAVKASDPDGDALILEAFNLPPFVSFTDNGDGTGAFNLAPQMADIGVYHKVRVRVTDSRGSMNTQYYTIKVLDPYAFIATANSFTPNNLPENTLDNNLQTRWEGAEAGGNWIKYDLREDKLVTGVQIAFHSGSTVAYPFDIEVSEDNNYWTKVFSAVSSGASTEMEMFSFPQVRARHLRVSDAGTMANSYTEVVIKATTAPVTHRFIASDDIFTDSRKIFNTTSLKAKEARFMSHLRFSVSDLNVSKAPVISSRLKIRADETAYGSLEVYLGEDKTWGESDTPSALPKPVKLLASVTNNFIAGQDYEIDLADVVQNNGTFNLVLVGTSTQAVLSFSSSEGSASPQLLVETLRGATPVSTTESARLSGSGTMEEAEWMQEAQIFPNPVTDQMTIGFGGKVTGVVTVEITDKAGKPVFRQAWVDPEGSIVIDVRNLDMHSGMYIVNLKQEGFAPKTMRIFKW